jgi:alanine racemase
VSMDMINVDLTDLPVARVGDRVVLWGGHLPIEEIAVRAGTIPYELMCGLSERVATRMPHSESQEPVEQQAADLQ